MVTLVQFLMGLTVVFLIDSKLILAKYIALTFIIVNLLIILLEWFRIARYRKTHKESVTEIIFNDSSRLIIFMLLDYLIIRHLL